MPRSAFDGGAPPFLHSASTRSILLLEDVDAAFVGREAMAAAGGGGGAAGGRLSFSGLLNAIDGVSPMWTSGQTTNL